MRVADITADFPVIVQYNPQPVCTQLFTCGDVFRHPTEYDSKGQFGPQGASVIAVVVKWGLSGHQFQSAPKQ